jgi:hypothetical protein
VPDDLASSLRSVPVLKAYDRQQVEHYLTAVEAEAAHLEQRLAAAQARRARAEHAIIARPAPVVERVVEPGLADALRSALEDLRRDEQDHAVTLADLRAVAADEARRVLSEAEHEVVTLRTALRDVLDELEQGDAARRHTDPGPTLAVVPTRPVLRPVPTRSAGFRDHPSSGEAARSVGHVGRRPWLQALASGPSLAG